jgi:hypothetical protein
MKKTAEIFMIAAALATVGAVAAQGPAVTVHFALKSSTVEAGVPLMVAVTVRNDTDAAQPVTIGRYEVDWTVRSRAGAEVAQWKPGGDFASLGKYLAPHAEEEFTIVASGTATILSPGEYEIVPRYRPLDISERLPFTVVPGDAAVLGLRAQEFHDAAIIKGENGLRAAEALAAIAYAVPTSQLCDVVERNPLTTYAIAPRLETEGGVDAVRCLIRIMSVAPVQGLGYAKPALQRLGKSEKDPALRSEIEKAVGQ